MLKRLPNLEPAAAFATCVVSDRAGALPGAIVIRSCGAIVD